MKHLLKIVKQGERDNILVKMIPAGYRKTENEVDHWLLWHLGEEKREIRAYALPTYESNFIACIALKKNIVEGVRVGVLWFLAM